MIFDDYFVSTLKPDNSMIVTILVSVFINQYKVHNFTKLNWYNYNQEQ